MVHTRFCSEARVVTQPVKPLLVLPVSYTGVPHQVPVALLLIQLLADEPGKAVDDDPNTWAPATHVRDPHSIPGS